MCVTPSSLIDEMSHLTSSKSIAIFICLTKVQQLSQSFRKIIDTITLNNAEVSMYLIIQHILKFVGYLNVPSSPPYKIVVSVWYLNCQV
jgi:hypothetical protein